ncbi:glycoside hydrolase family 3 N-terminal domain-containing protein [Haloactinopolyspora sp.]|uniref:glycoside hydrolase family 3 N-terminal domain-containing protein n=1 Tax=Haloactinopolyspora sp. TaxID=1966353 RepID=UPI00261DB20C|nr:glycoside hydrolase family 3 N-terminal domain-containing protein [Haloactinopolyspora sp.]
MRTRVATATGWLSAVVVITSALSACGGDEPSAAPSETESRPAASDTASPSPSGPPTAPQTPGTTPSSPPASPDVPVDCPDQTLARLDLDEKVGQLFMGGVQVGETPAYVSDDLGAAQVGSLLLIGQLTGGTSASAEAADRGREVAGAPAGVQPFVATDQEGGLVQHLKGDGFATMPSAEEQSSLPPQQLRSEAQAWGEDLRTGGIDVNLAPVADVVPEDIGDANQPVGAVQRGYGPDRSVVAAQVAAYVQGMNDAGVATAVKHFPGLGKVEGNTDFSSGVVDTRTTRDDADLEPFAAGLRAGAPFLMVALSTYEQIDPDRRAVFSPTVIDGMVRGDLGFNGVVLSDDLGAAVEVEDVPPARRALDFLRAGGDIAIVSTPELLPEMTEAVIDEAEADAGFAQLVDEHVLRVLTVKERMGLLTCDG